MIFITECVGAVCLGVTIGILGRISRGNESFGMEEQHEACGFPEPAEQRNRDRHFAVAASLTFEAQQSAFPVHMPTFQAGDLVLAQSAAQGDLGWQGIRRAVLRKISHDLFRIGGMVTVAVSADIGSHPNMFPPSAPLR
ncbi:MAG TPA: hypothetical protein VMC85_25375 [Desulfomonilaceae bacterium]|nr:hypothetical protein [Desulfomonilaceae bacterium]HVM71500.1 hypothetical protein [Anaerolineales bacterium]